MTAQQTNRIDVHQQVTDRIISAIEAGAGEFRMPWHTTGHAIQRPRNFVTGNSYRGINVISLWVAAEVQGFANGIWGTYRQWQQAGGQVRKGEKASLVVFYKEIDVQTADDATGGTKEETRFIAKPSFVFNVDQVDGIDFTAPEPVGEPAERHDAIEAFVQATGANIHHGGERAFYRPSDDIIQLPERDRFIAEDTLSATEGYYAVLLHELTHWTGAKHRLDRETGKRFGDNAYAMEELVAELGAAFLCADLGISLEPRKDHAAYLDSWLKALKADKKAIFSAASLANKAAEYLHNLQPERQEVAA
jgi:antirestriction protein ArdC